MRCWSLGRCHHPVGRMTVTTTRTEPSAWGPSTRTFDISSMCKELQLFSRRGSQIETIYQTITKSNGYSVYINSVNGPATRNPAKPDPARLATDDLLRRLACVAAFHCSSIRFITCGTSSARSSRSFTRLSPTWRADGEVRVARGVAFLHGLARIAIGFTFRLRSRQRNRRPQQVDEVAGATDRPVAEIPPGVGRHRHDRFSCANTRELVAVVANLRDEQRKRLAGLPPRRNRSSATARQ